MTWEAREGFSEFLIFLLGLGQCDKEGPQMNAEEDRPKVNSEKYIYTSVGPNSKIWPNTEYIRFLKNDRIPNTE